MTVDILCAVLDGERFLSELLESLAAQTHGDWRLWVRDDGSRDGTVELLHAAAMRDGRIRLAHVGGPPGGAARAFGWLLERLPNDAAYVMFADQDDVWLPEKIETTLSAMHAAEARAPSGTPVLVHTDLTVTDARLHPVHRSLWQLSGVDPEPVSLRRFVVQPVTTGATAMLNRPLRELAGPIPREAIYHDWWCALAAAAFGRVVALREPTMLYRQHGRNAVGARDARLSLTRVARAIV